jgi:hypothetical protein
MRQIEGKGEPQGTQPTYKFKEGDRVMVCFEEYINQPGISKYQSNEHTARTDFTTARSWKVGTITMLALHGEIEMAEVMLDSRYKKYTRGFVAIDRLQPYIPEVM